MKQWEKIKDYAIENLDKSHGNELARFFTQIGVCIGSLSFNYHKADGDTRRYYYIDNSSGIAKRDDIDTITNLHRILITLDEAKKLIGNLPPLKWLPLIKHGIVSDGVQATEEILNFYRSIGLVPPSFDEESMRKYPCIHVSEMGAVDNNSINHATSSMGVKIITLDEAKKMVGSIGLGFINTTETLFVTKKIVGKVLS